MSLHRAMAEYLAAQSPVSALVGTRVYIGRLPQSAIFPAITMHQISIEGSPHQAGAGATATALVQVSAWAATHSAAVAVAEAVRGELDGYPGGTWGTGGDATIILRCDQANALDDVIEDTDGRDQAVYHIPADYYVYHRRTVPTF